MSIRSLAAGCGVVLAALACAEAPTELAAPQAPSLARDPEYAVGCPAGGFLRAPVSEQPAAYGPYDRNRDGMVCGKATPGGHVVIMDNTSVVGHRGACQNGFSFVPAANDDPFDANGNGGVCQATTPAGDVVTVDDDDTGTP